MSGANPPRPPGAGEPRRDLPGPRPDRRPGRGGTTRIRPGGPADPAAQLPLQGAGGRTNPEAARLAQAAGGETEEVSASEARRIVMASDLADTASGVGAAPGPDLFVVKEGFDFKSLAKISDRIRMFRERLGLDAREITGEISLHVNALEAYTELALKGEKPADETIEKIALGALREDSPQSENHIFEKLTKDLEQIEEALEITVPKDKLFRAFLSPRQRKSGTIISDSDYSKLRLPRPDTDSDIDGFDSPMEALGQLNRRIDLAKSLLADPPSDDGGRFNPDPHRDEILEKLSPAHRFETHLQVVLEELRDRIYKNREASAASKTHVQAGEYVVEGSGERKHTNSADPTDALVHGNNASLALVTYQAVIEDARPAGGKEAEAKIQKDSLMASYRNIRALYKAITGKEISGFPVRYVSNRQFLDTTEDLLDGMGDALQEISGGSLQYRDPARPEVERDFLEAERDRMTRALNPHVKEVKDNQVNRVILKLRAISELFAMVADQKSDIAEDVQRRFLREEMEAGSTLVSADQQILHYSERFIDVNFHHALKDALNRES